jgi:SpoVK/Ycf46/Vps4 family AAA+-type ATPase
MYNFYLKKTLAFMILSSVGLLTIPTHLSATEKTNKKIVLQRIGKATLVAAYYLRLGFILEQTLLSGKKEEQKTTFASDVFEKNNHNQSVTKRKESNLTYLSPCVARYENEELSSIEMPVGQGVAEGLEKMNSFSPLTLEQRNICEKNNIPCSSGGVILHGVGGTGKTTMAKYFARKYGFDVTVVDCGKIFETSYVGEHLVRFRNAFDDIETFVKEATLRDRRVLVILDEVDALLGQASSGLSDSSSIRTSEVINAFKGRMDGFENSLSSKVYIVATTNNIERLDEAVKRRLGSVEVKVGLPTEADKVLYLKKRFPLLSKISEDLLKSQCWFKNAKTLAALKNQAEAFLKFHIQKNPCYDFRQLTQCVTSALSS